MRREEILKGAQTFYIKAISKGLRAPILAQNYQQLIVKVLFSTMEQNIVACASSSRKKVVEVSPVIENLAQDLTNKVKVNKTAGKKAKFTNTMKGEVKATKQYVVVTKVLDRKLNTMPLRSSLVVAWSPCRIPSFEEVNNHPICFKVNQYHKSKLSLLWSNNHG